MDLMNIVTPVVSIGALGLTLGIGLGVASKKFAVEIDETESKINEVLPGANCGGCGYPGCGGLASAIAQGKEKANSCPVGGSSVAKKIADILGVVAEEIEKKTSYIKCNGTCENAKLKYEYSGLQDCRAISQTAGSSDKLCTYGCVGLGTCVRVCKFDALSIVNGIAVVDKDKCTACSTCVNICPKNLIELVPIHSNIRVQCNSKDKGKDTKDNCNVGCIGCKRCEKTCKSDAIHVVDNIAKIDYTKCTNCKDCISVCSQKTIIISE